METLGYASVRGIFFNAKVYNITDMKYKASEPTNTSLKFLLISQNLGLIIVEYFNPICPIAPSMIEEVRNK